MTVRTWYDVRVPVRDGLTLSADVWRPDTDEPVHVVLSRTPYVKNNERAARFGRLFASRGLAFVMMDVRGRGDSDGDFWPYVNDARDGVDVIAWLAEQEWCSASVATLGGSYGGLTQWLTAVQRPPALKAMIAIVSPSDPFVEFPTGTPVPMMLSWHRLTHGRVLQHVGDVDWDRVYRHLPLVTMDEAAGFVAPHWREQLSHPVLDEFWAPKQYQGRMHELDLPVLHISGWYDDEQVGTPVNFARMVAGGAAGQQLLMGPWGHAVNTVRQIGEVDFGTPSSTSRGTGCAGSTRSSTAHRGRTRPSGCSSWASTSGATARCGRPPTCRCGRCTCAAAARANSRLGDGRLTWEAPADDEPDDRYDYFPERPVPFLTGVTSAQLGGPDDYSAVELRGDVLVYSTEPLGEPLQLIGPVSMVLHATTSAPDTDWVVRLLDVHPTGFAQRLTDGLVRARYRDGFYAERLLEPGVANEYQVDLWHTAHVFLPGHRLRVEVTSSAFPKYDRNLNTGEPLATSTRMETAHQVVHHDAARPSRLLCPVVPL